MTIDVWFPLAIYYTDLADQLQYQSAYLERIYQLQALAGEKRTPDTASWTGDVHKIDQIHNDATFSWLTAQIEYHALAYLDALGHDLNKIELFIQRSWPIIARKGQWVSRHSHPNANLSAVYYVSIPKTGHAGQTRFYSDSKQNELANAISSTMTNGYREQNVLNFQQANYHPVEGRLLMFPGKQSHDVATNETDEDRVSISFDIVMTAKQGLGAATPEFLMPSPENWKKFDTGVSQQFVRPQPGQPTANPD